MSTTTYRSKTDRGGPTRAALPAILVTALSALAGCGGGGGGGGSGGNVIGPPPSRSAETLVYIASDGVSTTGQSELYAAEDDGTGQRMLSPSAVADASRIASFAVSPDRQWVAYIANQDGFRKALYVVPIAGGTATQVSRHVGQANRFVDSFDWSPDSTQLVYAANLDAPLLAGAGNNFLANEIYVVKRDGTGETKINGAIQSPAVVELKNPQWSPDGHYILQEVFRFDGTGVGPLAGPAFALNIYDATKGVANSTRLVTSQSVLRNVHWSPDSQRFAYLADQSVSGEYQLFTMNVAGGDTVQLTKYGDFNSVARWSPDGSKVAFLDNPSQPFPSDLMVNDGGATTDLVALSAGGPAVKEFAWSPDGTRIAYTADADQTNVNEAYVVAADGSNAPTKISGPLVQSGDVFEIGWAPNGQYIAYLADQDIDTNIDLYVSTAAGANNTRIDTGLTNEEVDRFQWSADGAAIAFTTGVSARTVVPDALRVRAGDGSDARTVSGDLLTDIHFEYVR